MSTVDENRVILIGENSAIRLSQTDGDFSQRVPAFGASCLLQEALDMFST